MRAFLRHYFNPRSREGSDCRPRPSRHTISRHFNPRSREGSDLIEDHADAYGGHFNPRSREGSDEVGTITNAGAG